MHGLKTMKKLNKEAEVKEHIKKMQHPEFDKNETMILHDLVEDAIMHQPEPHDTVYDFSLSKIHTKLAMSLGLLKSKL